MSLTELQGLFYAAISKPTGNDSEALAVDLIKKTGRLSPLKRLDIYRNSGLASRIRALQHIYPTCESILGERVFVSLAREYSINNDSLSNDLNVYGKYFPAFIEYAVEQHQGLNDFVYLKDLCRLEWLWHKIYYQKNNPAFDFERFALYSQKADEISLHTSPGLEFMLTALPVHDIWRQHRQQQVQSAVPGLSKTQYLCIYRDNFFPKIEKISKAEYFFLKACRQGHTLGEIAADNEVSTAIQKLPQMIKRGWICSFSYDVQRPAQSV